MDDRAYGELISTRDRPQSEKTEYPGTIKAAQGTCKGTPGASKGFSSELRQSRSRHRLRLLQSREASRWGTFARRQRLQYRRDPREIGRSGVIRSVAYHLCVDPGRQPRRISPQCSRANSVCRLSPKRLVYCGTWPPNPGCGGRSVPDSARCEQPLRGPGGSVGACDGTVRRIGNMCRL